VGLTARGTLAAMAGRSFLGLAVAASLLTLSPATALGATRPDPDSPAGVEYELPLERARERAAGGNDGAAPGRGSRPGGGAGGGAAPLFGAGVGPPGRGEGSDAAGGGGADGRSGVGRGRERAAAGDDGARGPSPGSSSSDRPGAEGPPGLAASAGADGASGTLATGGIVLGVLLAAGMLGLLLRRTFRSGQA